MPAVDCPNAEIKPTPSQHPEKNLLKRAAPPFILFHDVPRGIIQMAQSALSFAFMLAVMYVLYSNHR
jgi:hypothetical protein